MQVSPWHKNSGSLTIHPKRVVYTLEAKYMNDPGEETILCDFAWTEVHEMRTHHWFTTRNLKCNIVSMTFHDYIQRHFKEVHGMNAFWDIGRLEFAKAYAEEWDVTIDGARQRNVEKT